MHALVKPFIEEVLRYEPGLQGLFRIARRDTSVGGVEIRKGDIVMVLYASANRDEACFDRPEAFQLRRYCTAATRKQLSFSHGAHFCAGAPLARLQAKVTTQETLRRLRNIRFPEGARSIPYASSVLTRKRRPARRGVRQGEGMTPASTA
jgi:cytochrome P450